MSLTIWTNAKFNAAATRLLGEGTARHRLIVSQRASSSVLVGGAPDPALASADVAFGQPDAGDCLRCAQLRWVEVTSAGYERYDNAAFREGFRERGSIFTTASGVFADPCAQHVLAMMLALGRSLLASHRDQLGDRAWNYQERRYENTLLTGQTAVLLGFGAIGRRLTELLAPLGMKLYAVRRSVRSEPGVHIIPEEKISGVLSLADHVVNLLPDNEGTRNYVNARRLACFKPGARFYNVGRGSTVDEKALLAALNSGRLGAAYLDVFETEPLPPDHPLWSAPRCYVTPHTAGGRRDQDEAIVRHFLANLAEFERRQPMADRIV
ncbi:MAG: D-isomer specific 2-hydroxyacid dehydrogenase NAD-binding [Verrucomicrobia bacterium]|nr:D-isomer specific 2-hydroxyacid dehydrogenase NAD-binding [Verrucomicrobiota bacterium]